jgi:ADP-glucose pyrophosphorylase
MLGKEKKRLLDFILSKTANEPIQIIINTLKQKRRELQFSFELGVELSKEIHNYTFQITLNNTNTNA